MTADWFIFLQAMYSKEELNGDSNVVMWQQFIREAVRQRPYVTWVIVWPDSRSGYKYEDDGFFDLPGVHRVPQRIPVRRTSAACHFDSNWYMTLYKRLAFDLVWSQLPEVSAQLRYAGEPHPEPVSKPVVVTQHNYVIHKSLPYEYHEHLAMAQLSGALASQANVFNSEHCVAMFRDQVDRYLVPDQGARIAETAVRIDYGTLEPDLGPTPERPPNPVPVIVYNHRLLSHKNWKATFTMLDELYRDGVAFELHLLANTNEKAGHVRHYPWLKMKLSPTRAEYLAALRMGDINVLHSRHETFCISAVESMALGQPLVAPAGITFPQITGADQGNGYPYLFDTPAQCKAMVRDLLTDPERRAKWGDVVRKHVMAHYTTPLWVTSYFELFDRLATWKRIGMPDEGQQHLVDGLKACAGQTLPELMRHLWQHSEWRRTPLPKLLRIMRHVEARLEFDGAQQRGWPPQ